MSLSVLVLDRETGAPLSVNGTLVPQRYSWRAVGGPAGATIELRGPAVECESALGWLRCPVEIWHSALGRVWWGYVHEVEVDIGGVTYAVNLDEVYNRVAVQYEDRDASGTSGTSAMTAWAEDAESIATYGYRETVLTANNSNQAAAEQKRNAYLAKYSQPIRTWKPGTEADKPTATLHCLGWWQTLGWRSYSRSLLMEGSSEWPWFTISFANYASSQRAYQTLQLGGTYEFWAEQLVLVLGKSASSPHSNLVIDLVQDNATSGLPQPGTVLYSWSIDPGSGDLRPDSYIWSTHTLSPRVLLDPTRRYGIYLHRADNNQEDGTAYKVNCYATGNDLYPRGNFYLYNANTSTWYDETQVEDAGFQLYGAWRSSTQLGDIITSAGQFLSLGTLPTIELYQPPYRAANSNALTEVEQLLALGDGSGNGLIAVVNPDRTVSVYTEPAPGYADYYYGPDGQLYDLTHVLVPPERCPVGIWVRPDPLIYPVGVAASYVEEMEFDCQERSLRPTMRGERNVWGD